MGASAERLRLHSITSVPVTAEHSARGGVLTGSMRTLNQSRWCVPLAPYQPVTDAIVCMRTFALRRHDRHGPVSPKADAVTWPDRPTKAQIPAPRAQRQIVCRVGCASQRDGVESTARERVTRGGGVETNHFDRRWRSGGVGRLRSLHQGRHRPRGPRGVLSRCAAGSFTRDGPESLGLSTHPTETDERQRVGCFLLTQSDCAPTWTAAPRQQRQDRPNGHSPLTVPSDRAYMLTTSATAAIRRALRAHTKSTKPPTLISASIESDTLTVL
jgi:hypothetical protein